MKKRAACTVLGLMFAVGAYLVNESLSPAFAESLSSSEIYMIDGDTADINGKRYRLVGYDTPETYRAQCAFERTWGNQATDRVRELMRDAGSVELMILPGQDRYGRGLARIIVQGADLGDLLIAENLARPYNGGRRAGWCD